MYIIKIFCPFAKSDECKSIYERINNVSKIDFYGKNKKIYITSGEDYTHAIIINVIMPHSSIPKENVIGLAFEPITFLGITPEFVEYAQKHIGKYFIGDKLHLPDPFIEHFGYMWYSNPSEKITYKPKIMSIIVSMKNFAPGHIYRHELVKKIIEHNLPIDIYGYGSNLYNYHTVKGVFDETEPYKDYMFSVCIENFKCNHYFSEKIINPILLNCMPIYIGCKNIDSYFENIIQLTCDIDEDIIILKKILTNPNLYYKRLYNEKNCKTVNLIENIEKIFSPNKIIN